MITRKDYEIKGNFKYYEYYEINRRFRIYEDIKSILTLGEQAMLEFGSINIANLILNKYEDNDLKPQIIADLNIKEEILKLKVQELKDTFKWDDEEVNDYINLYNKYPYILYLYISTQILSDIYKILHT